MTSREELVSEYRKLARRADDRLRTIEAVSHRPEFKGIKSFAYKSAINDIQKTFKSTGKRFNTKPPKSDTELQAKINAIKKFLGKQSSTPTGVKHKYMDTAKTLNERYGTNFQWQDLAKYYGTGLNKQLENLIGGSGDTLNVVAELQKSGKSIVDAIKKNKEIYIVDDIDMSLDDSIIQIEIDDEITASEIDNLLQSDEGREAVLYLLKGRKKTKAPKRKKTKAPKRKKRKR